MLKLSLSESSMEGHNILVEAGGSSKLLVGSSEYVLTYEDKEGDWMLVGDVPWRYILFFQKVFNKPFSLLFS